MPPGARATCSRTRLAWASCPARSRAAWCCRRASPGAPPLLGLSFDTQAALADDPAQSALRELTLSLDVPQVHRSEQPFVRMRDAAVALAAAMDGIITDDNGEVIRAEGMDVIGADLEQLYDTLDARDLAAGSPLARRLFS